MCGRFALNINETELRSHFALKNGFVFKEKYNIAPTQTIPVIILSQLGLPELVFMRWGLIPSWQKEVNVSNTVGYFNARVETLAEKPTFKQAFTQRRCLIPATGFYEWRLIHERKQPFFIYLKHQPLFALAGIWAMPTVTTGLPTCAIITQATQENSSMAAIHSRMPVIVPLSQYQTWLNPRTKMPDMLPSILSTEAEFGYFPVSLQVNSAKFNHPDCLRPLA